MSDLSSKFTREDVEKLIESIGDWEMIGSQEYHISQMIRNAPMPPEDHDAYETMNHIKEHFRKRDKEIKASREMRHEAAIFLKAKLMMVRRDLEIGNLFDMAESVSAEPVVSKKTEKESIVSAKQTGNYDLEMAEFFIRDLGVWEHYQKFLLEKKNQ